MLAAGGAAPQSPKSSSGATLGGAGAAPKPPKPPTEAGGAGSPHPLVSLAGMLLAAVQPVWAVVADGLLQSDCGACGVVLLVGSGELPQPKSAPVTDLTLGLVMERPVWGVATAGSWLLHSLEPHGSVERLLKDVLVAGAEDCITAL